MTKKRSPKSNLKFFMKRHEEAGCDFDYLDKLSPQELEFLEKFTRGHYTGDRKAIEDQGAEAALSPERTQEIVEEAHHRHYMNTPSGENSNTGAEALMRRTETTCNGLDDLQCEDLDPEKLLLLRERLKIKST